MRANDEIGNNGEGHLFLVIGHWSFVFGDGRWLGQSFSDAPLPSLVIGKLRGNEGPGLGQFDTAEVRWDLTFHEDDRIDKGPDCIAR